MYYVKTDAETAETLAEYFNSISSEYPPLNMDNLPQSHSRMMPVIEEKEIEDKITKCKKTSSILPGNLDKNLFRQHAKVLAQPFPILHGAATVETGIQRLIQDALTLIPFN